MSDNTDLKKLTQEEKSRCLEKTVLTGTPEETAEVYDKLGRIAYTVEAMIYACRFRGLSHVKVLTEKGAQFDNVFIGNTKPYACILDIPENFHSWYGNVSSDFQPSYGIGMEKRFALLPFEERARILDYLMQNNEKTRFDAEVALFYAILVNDAEMYEELKKHGAKFGEDLIKIITDGKRSYTWDEYVMFVSCDLENFFEKIDRIFKETGGDKPLNFTENLYAGLVDRFYRDDYFSYILEHFNQKKMSKTHIMKVIIKNELTSLLPITEKHGWLKMPKKRDEMIEFAAECRSAECAAWLLDFKNRTADLPKEEENREKKEQRELNASPDSVFAMKKLWNYKKLDDGSVMITGYKGGEKEVTVPESIGKSPVTAIGEYAFSPHAPRLRTTDNYDPVRIRRDITKVTLPDTVRLIGGYAFCYCDSLKCVNIPEGVEKISECMFYNCSSLQEIDLPSSVTEIEQNAFCFCSSALKSVTVPDSVRIIGQSAFYKCAALENITLSQNLEKLEKETFYGCASLESIMIPEGVKEIKGKMFINCVKLKNVRLPASLEKIINYRDSAKNSYGLFDRNANVTAEVKAGSYAEKYCKRYDIAYVYY